MQKLLRVALACLLSGIACTKPPGPSAPTGGPADQSVATDGCGEDKLDGVRKSDTSVRGATVGLFDLMPGEATDSRRIKSSDPIWIGYEILAGLTESDLNTIPGLKDTMVVRIERLGDVKPGNVGGLSSTALTAATKFIPQDGFVEVKIHNLSGRRISVRLYTGS